MKKILKENDSGDMSLLMGRRTHKPQEFGGT